MTTPRELINRINDYLLSGGLFNPELIDPERIRDILIDCRTYLQEQEQWDNQS